MHFQFQTVREITGMSMPHVRHYLANMWTVVISDGTLDNVSHFVVGSC